jgi:rod shape determining protein RodA
LLAIPALLIFKQPDLGSTLVVAAFWWAIFFAADLPLKYFIGTTVAALASLPLVWRFLAEYQKQRITAFLNPYADPRGSGYHLLQSIIAVGSGGFFGRGLGRGIQSQLRFLPESNTDFIFASLAEELGLAGSALLLIAYFLLLKRLLFIARQAPDNFSQLLTVGVFAMMLFQLLVNIGMNLGILPITGITLPLVSSGGSSLLATMISLGLVHNISRQQLPLKSLEIK